MTQKKKKVVTLGSGTGQKQLVRALTSCCYVTSIVCVTDNGGHSGLLRKQFDILAVGDINHVLLASAEDQDWKKFFKGRNTDPRNSDYGASMGNYLLAALCIKNNNLATAVNEAEKLLKCRARVVPATIKNTNITAELCDGSMIVGEWQIIERQPRLPIKRLFLSPSVKAYASAVEAIMDADWIIIAPGAIETGIISVLLAAGTSGAIKQTPAGLIHITNIMTQIGATGYPVKNQIDIISHYADRVPDYVIANTNTADINHEILELYRNLNSQPVIYDSNELNGYDCKFMASDLLGENGEARFGDFKSSPHLITHSSAKLRQVIVDLL